MPTVRSTVCAFLAGAILAVPCAAQSSPVTRRLTSPVQRTPVRAESTLSRANAARVLQPRTTVPAATVPPPQVGNLATTRETLSVTRTGDPQRVLNRVPPQETLAKPRPAAQHTVTDTRLRVLLGASPAALRVVRASGVSDVPARGGVTVTPGEFVFRKVSDTARRVSRVPGAVRPPSVPAPTPPATTPAATPADTQANGKPTIPAPPVGSPTPSRAAATAFAMPYRWLTIDSTGTEHVLIPYFIVIGGGLTYDVGSRQYRGTALVGVEDSLARTAEPIPLPKPLRMQLLATSSGGRVAPAQLAISHTSLDYHSVRIESPESTYVRIRTSADPAGVIIPIRVLNLSVTLTPRAIVLQGFGLATTDVTLALPRGMARSDSAVVSFSSRGTSVRPASVTVTGASGGSVRLRSGLPGADTVRAFLDGVEVGEIAVRSEPPVAFGAATLLGTILGGAARFVSAKRRKRARALPWDIVRGAPFGVVVALGSAVGLDLLHLKLGEPGALPAIVVLAALGAWAGARVLGGAGVLSDGATAARGSGQAIS